MFSNTTNTAPSIFYYDASAASSNDVSSSFGFNSAAEDSNSVNEESKDIEEKALEEKTLVISANSLHDDTHDHEEKPSKPRLKYSDIEDAIATDISKIRNFEKVKNLGIVTTKSNYPPKRRQEVIKSLVDKGELTICGYVNYLLKEEGFKVLLKDKPNTEERFTQYDRESLIDPKDLLPFESAAGFSKEITKESSEKHSRFSFDSESDYAVIEEKFGFSPNQLLIFEHLTKEEKHLALPGYFHKPELETQEEANNLNPSSILSALTSLKLDGSLEKSSKPLKTGDEAELEARKIWCNLQAGREATAEIVLTESNEMKLMTEDEKYGLTLMQYLNLMPVSEYPGAGVRVKLAKDNVIARNFLNGNPDLKKDLGYEIGMAHNDFVGKFLDAVDKSRLDISDVVNYPDPDFCNNTALHVAAAKGYSDKNGGRTGNLVNVDELQVSNLDLVQKLLRAGANPNLNNTQNNNNINPFHVGQVESIHGHVQENFTNPIFASNLGVPDEDFADIKRNLEGESFRDKPHTPLSIATARGDVEMVNEILTYMKLSKESVNFAKDTATCHAAAAYPRQTGAMTIGGALDFAGSLGFVIHKPLPDNETYVTNLKEIGNALENYEKNRGNILDSDLGSR